MAYRVLVPHFVGITEYAPSCIGFNPIDHWQKCRIFPSKSSTAVFGKMGKRGAK